MPMKYQCRQPFCNKLVDNRGDYCEQHRQNAPVKQEVKEEKKMFATATRSNEGKYNDDRWRKLVKRVRERDGNECALCGSTKQLEVHHYIQGWLDDEDFYDDDICILLCHSCHEKYTREGYKKQ